MSARTDVELDLWDAIAAHACSESALWADALLSADVRGREPVFSPLGLPEQALGLETIYEGYLVHYGRPRLFAPADEDTALLLGDYLYAHGLVHVATLGDFGAVGDFAELISLCAHLRADKHDGDGVAWAATAALLGTGRLGAARDALRLDGNSQQLERVAREAVGGEVFELALAAHERLVG